MFHVIHNNRISYNHGFFAPISAYIPKTDSNACENLKRLGFEKDEEFVPKTRKKLLLSAEKLLEMCNLADVPKSNSVEKRKQRRLSD